MAAGKLNSNPNPIPDLGQSATMAVEFLQAHFLHALFYRETRDIFLAKGGMAMTLLGSKRWTKDVDLAADPTIPITTICSKMRAAIHKSLGIGLLKNVTLSEKDVGNGGVSPKWSINGYLPNGTHVHLKIEVSRRDLMPEEGIKRFEVKANKEFGVPSYVARTYSEMAVAASKTAALLDPGRNAPRDIYDLYMLIQMEVTPPIEMLAALGKREIERMLLVVWDKMESMNWNEFSSKVLPHLPPERAKIADESFYNDMRLLVAVTLEDWLNQAGEIAEAPIPRAELRNRIEEVRERKQNKVQI